jgi:hypothetical protein
MLIGSFVLLKARLRCRAARAKASLRQRPRYNAQAIISALNGRRGLPPLPGAKRSVDSGPRTLPWISMRRRFQRREMPNYLLEPWKAARKFSPFALCRGIYQVISI